jgi:putative ABC transport system ATP-binding protein
MPASGDAQGPAGAGADGIAARVTGLRKVYGSGATATVALCDVDLLLRRGEVVALTGPSGSGKSTLLHLLGAMDEPTAGSVQVAGLTIAGLSDAKASAFRNRHVGFVFQSFHLVPTLTVQENIALPGRLAARPAAEVAARAAELAARVGLGAMLKRRPDQLSGGERQRVAIARALINDPALLLADEPTGNLDHAAGAGIMQLFRELSRERGLAVLVASHDPLVTAAADRRVALLDGRLQPGQGA